MKRYYPAHLNSNLAKIDNKIVMIRLIHAKNQPNFSKFTHSPSPANIQQTDATRFVSVSESVFYTAHLAADYNN